MSQAEIPLADRLVHACVTHCKEDLAMSQATKMPTPPVAGQATALLVIDVQQGLFRKSTPIYRAEPLLNTLTTLIERARRRRAGVSGRQSQRRGLRPLHADALLQP